MRNIISKFFFTLLLLAMSIGSVWGDTFTAAEIAAKSGDVNVGTTKNHITVSSPGVTSVTNVRMYKSGGDVKADAVVINSSSTLTDVVSTPYLSIQVDRGYKITSASFYGGANNSSDKKAEVFCWNSLPVSATYATATEITLKENDGTSQPADQTITLTGSTRAVRIYTKIKYGDATNGVISSAGTQKGGGNGAIVSVTATAALAPEIEGDSQMLNDESITLTGYPTGGSWAVVSGPGAIDSDGKLTASENGTIRVSYTYSDVSVTKDITAAATKTLVWTFDTNGTLPTTAGITVTNVGGTFESGGQLKLGTNGNYAYIDLTSLDYAVTAAVINGKTGSTGSGKNIGFGSAASDTQDGTTADASESTYVDYNVTPTKSSSIFSVIKTSGTSAYIARITLTVQRAVPAATHTLSSAVDPTGKGTVTLGTSTVAEGATTTAAYSAIDDAYEFDEWQISGTGASLSSTSTNPTTVTMGTENATVTLKLKVKTTKYAITKGDHDNGDFTISPATQAEGETVTLSATPAFRYLFGSWEVVKTEDGSATGITVDANGQFEMPAYGVTVNATFTADTRKQILYLTTASTSSDKMYAALNAVGDYNVIVEEPGSQTLANYDLVVLHESIAGNAADPTKSDKKPVILNIPTTTIPVLNTKSYFYTSARWNWGAAANGKKTKGMHVNTAYCNITSHPLFNDLTPDENDSIIVLSSINSDNKPMQPVTSFSSGKEGYTLANVPDGCAIHELTPAQRGVASGKYLLISVYNKDLNNLNANGQKLFQNAAAYLMGATSWTPGTIPTSVSITADPSAVYEVGDDISLSASATGTDASTTYTWYKGATLEDAKTAGAIKATATAAAGGDAYSKADCVAEDAGLYWCVISNGGTCEAAASLAVTVSSTPIISYDITFVSDHGTAPTATTGASIALTEITGVTGWQHTGWTANVNVEVDAATVTAGTLIANGKTAILASDVTFTAVWKQIITVTYNANGGTCGTASATYSAGDPALVLPDATIANLVFNGWYTAATGGTLVGRAGDTYTPTGDIEIFAQFGAKLYQAIYSNSFDAFINQANKTVTVYYLEGESAPTLTSVKAMKADGSAVAAGTFVDNGSTIDVTIDEKTATYAVTRTAVTPYTYVSGDPITFDGTETYIKTGNSFSTSSGKEGWKFSKNDGDWSRELPGNNRIYFFIGTAETITLTSGCSSARNIKVYRNGTEIFANTMPKNSASPNYITLTGSAAPAMYAVVSNQGDGDGAIKIMTLAPWVPTTAVALKEGDDPISEKEIWAGTNFTLTAEVTPDNASNKTITWTTSNEAVATVDNGVVTGVAANATPVTITATTVDGVYATCAVTVTAAPTPSADPVITTQPADGNYYECATIAALTVEATGSGDLSYQWYLGSDEIDGATNATYTPTVTAIGTYVYHCVVTNTEAGHLPTSLATDNATITIAEDPSAIKLLNGSTVNTTNFITGVTAEKVTISEVEYDCVKFSGTVSDVNGVKDLTRVIAYNATTNQTKIKLSLYNNSTSSRTVQVKGLVEGATEAVDLAAIELGNKEQKVSDWITFNNASNRTIYIFIGSSAGDVRFLQVKVLENGATPMKQAGEAGYSLNFNQGRFFGVKDVTAHFEGMNVEVASSDCQPLNTSVVKLNESSISFDVAAPLTLSVTTNNNKTYYVTKDAAGTDNETAKAGVSEFNLTAGTWFITGGASNVEITNIAFTAPKCAEPAFNALANSEICSGDPYVALDGTGTVSDGGSITYKWYAHGADESDPAAILATTATYTPTADGTYYVKALHHVDGYTDNEATSDEVTVTTYASAAITTAPTDVRQEVGQVATLSVVASGKAPLSYQWYTCDDAEGNNPVIIAGAEEDSYSVTVTANMDQYYKVVVSSGCGEASAVAKIVEWVELPQLSVSTTTTWDWVDAGENIKLTSETTPAKDEECVMANVKVGGKMPTNDATFNSQALLFSGENVRAKDGGRYYASLGHIKFNAAVSGKVTVEFSDNGTNDRRLKINEALSESSSSKTDIKTFSAIVPAGEVTLMGVNNDGSGSDRYIRISKIIFEVTPDVSDADYTRDLTQGRFGTICLPNGGVMVGADLFEIAYYGETSQKIFFDQIVNGVMEAGVPYIFLPREGASQLGVYYTDSENAPAGSRNGLIGSYTQEIVTPNDGNYILLNNQYCFVNSTAYVGANRAYIKLSNINPTEPALAPGRIRMSMGVVGAPQVATGCENIEASDKPTKVMINGQLFIIRGEKTFDATGRLVK